MTATATLVEDREDDRLYRVTWHLKDFALVSRYGSKMYGNEMTCIWPANEEMETTGSPLATYHGHVTHDEALRRFGLVVA